MKDILERLQKLLQAHREFVIFGVLVLGCISFYLAQPGEQNHFMTIGNWRVIAVNISTDALMVVGMTLVIIAGGFDLSVGSTLALGGIVCGKLMVAGVAVPVAMVAGLSVGALIGIVNGLIITKIGVNPLITTLAGMIIVRGLAQVVTQASPVTGLPSSFTALGGDMELFGWVRIPWPIVLMVVVVLVADFLLRRSRFLRQVYYVGGNEEAARFSGIRVDRVRIFTYVMTGVLSALAGIMSSARLISASASAGDGAELRVISAVVIGGASLSGGVGTVLGAFLGLLLVGVIENGMEIMRVNIYMKNVVTGMILILAVSADRLDREKLKRFWRWLRS
ncbi:MAG: ABC transporter permease [Verrucomicrobia bacterium]|nr:ABC transporter permease [Verrucomicrobiota bacterium]